MNSQNDPYFSKNPPRALLGKPTSERLAYFRKAKGLSQKIVASSVGVSQAAVNSWETGKTTPTFNNLYQLMFLYEVNPFYLVDADTWAKMKKKFTLRLGYSVEDLEDYEIDAMLRASDRENNAIPVSLKISMAKLNHIGKAAVCQYAEDLTYNPKYQETNSEATTE